jgi:hypothetical protein
LFFWTKKMLRKEARKVLKTLRLRRFVEFWNNGVYWAFHIVFTIYIVLYLQDMSKTFELLHRFREFGFGGTMQYLQKWFGFYLTNQDQQTTVLAAMSTSLSNIRSTTKGPLLVSCCSYSMKITSPTPWVTQRTSIPARMHALALQNDLTEWLNILGVVISIKWENELRLVSVLLSRDI